MGANGLHRAGTIDLANFGGQSATSKSMVGAYPYVEVRLSECFLLCGRDWRCFTELSENGRREWGATPQFTGRECHSRLKILIELVKLQIINLLVQSPQTPKLETEMILTMLFAVMTYLSGAATAKGPMRNAVVNVGVRHGLPGGLPGCPSCSSAGDEIRIFCNVDKYVAVGLPSLV